MKKAQHKTKPPVMGFGNKIIEKKKKKLQNRSKTGIVNKKFLHPIGKYKMEKQAPNYFSLR